MNILVIEHLDNSNEHYIIDTTKLNPMISFEKDFMDMLMEAVNSKDKSYTWRQFKTKKYLNIEERFSKYSDGVSNFEKLLIQLPCTIHKKVNIYYV